MSDRKRALLLAAICVTALVLRIGYGVAFDRFGAEPKWDADMYCRAARNILDGKGYSYDGVRPTTFWSPLYPVFLAGVFSVFGDNIVVARLVQVCLDSVTVLLIYALGSKVFNRRVGLVACAIAAVYPYFIHRSSILMSEVLAVPLLTAFALVLYYMKTDFRRRHIAAAGVLGALLMLCKANMQVLVLILPLWGFFAYGKWRTALARTLPAVAIMMLLVAPYLARNAKIEGRLVGISTTGGITLYGAHNEIVFSDPEFDGFWANTVRLGEIGCITEGKISDSDNSERQMRLGLEAIQKNPGKMPMHLLHKLRNFWLIHTHYFITDGAKAVIPQLFYMILLPFFLIGLVSSFRGSLRPVFFYLMFSALTLTILVFYGNARMRAPIAPMIIILASGGLVLAAGALWGERKAEPARGHSVNIRTRRIAYIMSQFPQTYETFILREIEGLAAEGLRPKIFSLKKCRDDIIHPAARRFLGRTEYSPFILSASLIKTNLRYAFTRPGKYFGALWGIFTSCLSHPVYMLKAFAVFPKAAHFAAVIEEENFGHIHAHWSTIPADSAMIIARLAGITWSVTAHAFDIYTVNPSLMRKLRSAKFFVTCTAYNVNYLSHFLPRRSRAPVYLNYHGIDLLRFEYEPHLPVDAEHLKVLAVGRLTETKGYPYLIEAMSILKSRGLDVACTIIGEGELRRDVEELIKSRSMEGRIKLSGAVSSGRVIRAMKRADCLIVPSIVACNGDRDGIPNVIPEAMALGLPVIACAISGIPEFVRDGQTGLLVSSGESKAIVAAIEKLIADGNAAKAMVKKARALVEKEFRIETNAAALLRLFESEVFGVSRAKKASLVHH